MTVRLEMRPVRFGSVSVSALAFVEREFVVVSVPFGPPSFPYEKHVRGVDPKFLSTIYGRDIPCSGCGTVGMHACSGGGKK